MSEAVGKSGTICGRLVGALILCLVAGACGGADEEPDGESAAATGEVPITLSVSVDGQTHQASGNGECKHADPAAIYGAPSSMWMVGFRGNGDIEQFRLTVWRPKSGGTDQLSLTLRTAAGTRDIDTVTGDGETVGSGTATIAPSGEGGRIEVNGRAADGTAIRAAIDCARFTGVESVGG